jgi:putative DNA primase/helicase
MVKKKQIKYLQPRKSGVRLYIPPAIDKLSDVSVPLYITEGEKKALAACQKGLCCVGLGGIWNWRNSEGLIPDLANIPVQGRKILIVPDSDVNYKSQVLAAVTELYTELCKRQADVEVIQLP